MAGVEEDGAAAALHLGVQVAGEHRVALVGERPGGALGPDHQRARLAAVRREPYHLQVVGADRRVLYREVRDVGLQQAHRNAGTTDAHRLMDVEDVAAVAPASSGGRSRRMTSQLAATGSQRRR